MIRFDHALPRVPRFNKTLPAGIWEQLYECAMVELDRAQLPRRTLGARHAIPDRSEEILTRPSGDEHTAPSIWFRTLRTIEGSDHERKISGMKRLTRRCRWEGNQAASPAGGGMSECWMLTVEGYAH